MPNGGKKMKKIKKYLFSILILVLLFCPTLVGCDFSGANISCESLASGDLVIYPNSQAMSWTEVDNAVGYDIYCNGKAVETVEAGTCIYKFGWLLDQAKTYEFKVKSVMTGTPHSSTTTYSGSYTLDTAISEKKSAGVISELDDLDTNATIMGNIIYFDKLSNPCNYAIGVESNSMGYNEYAFEADKQLGGRNYISLEDFPSVSKSEISAIRIIAKFDDLQNYVVSDILYYNPDNFSGYTDPNKIYLFDGKIYDHYINTLDELQTLVYRSFIYREANNNEVVANFDIKLSKEVYDLANACEGLRFIDRLDELVYTYGLNSFTETIVFQAGNTVGREQHFAKELSSSDRTYNIKIDFLVAECDTTLIAKRTNSQSVSTGYYETVDYTMLDDEYKDGYDFASDNRFLSTEVDSSEELYWAVETGVTPIVKTGSSAENIYNKAKSVLGKIISTEMTDFEKVLSVFDWICINTVYDYTEYTQYDDEGYYKGGSYPPACPCYYLEGVFIKGTAVCDGFSKAFSLMCNMLDIDAVRVVGTASSGGSIGGHAWNKVLLDNDPTDDIPAKYYLVDITWTELNYSAEILAHTYFLIDDAMVEETHFPYPTRDIFKTMPANEKYEYYSNRTFGCEEGEYDIAIDNDGDANKLFKYMLFNNIDNMEVVFDYDYMVSIYNSRIGTYNAVTDSSLERLLNEFNQYLRGEKFAEQYFTLVYSKYVFVYDNDGSVGVICVISQNLLIDADGEASHLVGVLDDYNVYGTYNLYVLNSILSGNSSSTSILDPTSVIKLVQQLFAQYLEESGIQIDFTLEWANLNLDGKPACLFQITISEKSNS